MISKDAPGVLASEIGFLSRVKGELLEKAVEKPLETKLGNCGYMVAARYLDEVIIRLTLMETEIRALNNRIGDLNLEISEYQSAFGDIDLWSDEEFKIVQEMLSERPSEDDEEEETG